jgi:hypothetical protein
MTANTPPPENERFREERSSALVALAAQPPAQPPDAHPSPEELAAFGEGRLNPADRERVLAHLDACSDCYEEWLAVAAALAADPPQPWWRWPTTFGARRYRRRRTLVWSGAGMALAACLALAVLVPWRTDSGLPALIDGAYETARAGAGPDLREIAARDTAPRREPASTYGFSAGAGSDAARAFAAGLLEGRSALSGGDHFSTPIPPDLAPSPDQPAESGAWQDTEWADYALLGRWVYLLQTVCKTSAQGSPAIWDAQRFIAAELGGRLARRPADDARARPVAVVVQDLEKALGESGSTASQRRCSRIQDHYDRLNALLPLTLPP